jgi:hypothetical protein
LGHLKKCRKEYEKDCGRRGKGIKMGVCNWNAKHQVYLPELKNHEERCEDRGKIVETIKYHNSGKT